MPNVVVIGGGISGLSCALNIADRRPDLDLRVLEASSRLGGTIHTDRTDGWICEAGPGAYIDRDPSTRHLIERLGLTSEVVSAGNAVRKRYIRHDGALHLYPDSPAAIAATNLLSEKGRKRMLLAPVRPALSEDDDWSVNEFARAHLGLEAAQMLLDPIVRGIYAGDARELSAASVLPQLVELARRGGRVCDALVGQGQGRVGKGSMVSLATGLGRLVEALESQLSDCIEFDRPVKSLTRRDESWWVDVGGESPEQIRADAVVFTPHGRTAQTCLGPLHAELPALLDAIPSPPVMVVNLGYAPGEIQHALDGFGYLVPSTEGGSILGMKWTTSIFPTGRAPAGHVLLQVFIGGSRNPSIGTLSASELIEQARAEVAQTLGATAQPAHVRVFAHRSGIPQYTVGHAERVQRIEAALAELPGLYLGGTTLHGVGINACTTSAERLAADVTQALAVSRFSRPAADQRLSIV